MDPPTTVVEKLLPDTTQSNTTDPPTIVKNPQPDQTSFFVKKGDTLWKTLALTLIYWAMKLSSSYVSMFILMKTAKSELAKGNNIMAILYVLLALILHSLLLNVEHKWFKADSKSNLSDSKNKSE
ncbi:hypothetical protein ACFE04_014956 [Oxalis oulophora]